MIVILICLIDSWIYLLFYCSFPFIDFQIECIDALLKKAIALVFNLFSGDVNVGIPLKDDLLFELDNLAQELVPVLYFEPEDLEYFPAGLQHLTPIENWLQCHVAHE